MSHHSLKNGYSKFTDRLNRFPQGAPPSESLYKILSILFTEKEAELLSKLPIKPFTAESAARIWGMNNQEAEKLLNGLAGKAMLLDMEVDGVSRYFLPPPMIGFFEFSLMRTRGDIDQKLLSELYHQYVSVEEDFIKDLFIHTETQFGRVFINEEVLSKEKAASTKKILSNENALHVLDYERASHVIKTASAIGVGMCYCRHKMEHLGKACDAPMDICMTFGNTAASMIKHGYARQIDASECMELLHKAYDYNLVQFGENVRQEVSFICNCCSCCCEAMNAARKFGLMNPIHTTNFIPRLKAADCSGCGKCVNVCPVGAMTLVSAVDPNNKNKKKAKLNEEICLGCGLCAKVCPKNEIGLEARKERVITPVNSTHRTVLAAIERGMLQNLIFDNEAYMSHRVMAAILGVILKLPPIKQIMASKQMKSVYLEKLLKNNG